MTYPRPGQLTWVAGQRLDAADLNGWPPPAVAWGYVTHASITSNSSSFTTIADVASLTVTFTAVADRLYIASFTGTLQSSISGDRIDIQITDGSNVVQGESFNWIPANNAPITCNLFTAPLEPGAGSITYKIRAERVSGSGTCVVVGSSTVPSTIRLHDIGPA